MTKTITIEFPDTETAKAFMKWLDNSGEQDYGEYIETVRTRHAVNKFTYDYENGKIIGELIV